VPVLLIAIQITKAHPTLIFKRAKTTNIDFLKHFIHVLTKRT